MGALVARLKALLRDAALRALALRLVAIGLLFAGAELMLEVVAAPALGQTWSAMLNAALLGLLAGAAVFVLFRGLTLRVARARRALELSEERFRGLTALSADWFWETDVDDRVAWLAGGASIPALFGEARVVGRRFVECDGVDLSPAARLAHAAQIGAREAFLDLELVRESADGRRVVHLVSGEPRFGADGALLGYRGVGRDVTRQRSAERALANAKERLDLAVEGAQLAVWDCDVATDLIYLSANWSVFLGEEPRDLVVPSGSLLERVHPDDRAAARASFVGAIKGDFPAYRAEYRLRTEDGLWRWLQGTGRVTHRDAHGRALRMSGVAIDIDARKRAERALRDTEARYRALIELSPDAILVHARGRIEFANPAAVRLSGARSARDLVGTRIEDLVHADDRARFGERLRQHDAGPGVVAFDPCRIRRFDGAERLVEAVSVSYLELGRPVAQAVLRDVTEQRRAREALAERERRFRDVVEASEAYVWETDAAWCHTYLSRRVEAVLGYTPAEMLGRTPRDFMPLGEPRVVEEWFARQAPGARRFGELQHRVVTKAGRVIWLSVSGVAVHDAGGQLLGYRGTASDVTARRQAEARLEFLARRDLLTGLPNRMLFGEQLQRAMSTAARGREGFVLLALGIDHFRLVNASLGHQAGDALLRAVAERLENSLRGAATLARLGGDSFVLLWEGGRGAAEAATVARRALGVLARPFTIEGHTLFVGTSVGASLYPEHGRDGAALLTHAEAAMHAAKELGRNAFVVFSSELSARASERLGLESDLRGALVRGELSLRWQPVVRRDRQGRPQPVGAEVLVRWQHPVRGAQSPDRFVPLAEQTGLIGALGEWTLGRALAQVGVWRRRLGGDLWFALNVSAAELAEGAAYVERVRAALQANGVPGAQLELEVTERALVANLPENVETLRQLGALGVRIAIDDFGTGYSSLAYLRRLPIHKLKIDRAFLRELDSHPADAHIVRAIAAMAQGLGVSVAAEGVENAAQLERLLALGCEEWQGHHFSEALEAAAFERLLEERSVAAG